MTNKEIAGIFKLTGALLELHGEDSFKTRSYTNAYMTIRKWGDSVSSMDKADIEKIPGVGKAISEKIENLKLTGSFPLLEELRQKTPAGVIEMLKVNGLGPKKVEIIWRQMGIEDPGSLLYACNENRLVDFKGFGLKSQKTIAEKLNYYFASKGKMLLPDAEEYLFSLVDELNKLNPQKYFLIAGEVLTRNPVVSSLNLLYVSTDQGEIILPQDFYFENSDTGEIHHDEKSSVKITEIECGTSYFRIAESWLKTKDFNDKKYAKEGWISPEDIQKIIERRETDSIFSFFFKPEFPYQSPEIWPYEAIYKDEKNLVDFSDVKGLVHLHTTYSDGLNTIEEMADEAIRAGLEYMVVTDHSGYAVYANGLKEDRLIEQIFHIENLQSKYPDFTILKGIECDILPDGSLDYSEPVWKMLDVIIISVHSVLNMDKDRATSRLIKAIENPYSHILGHPSGRVLLSREGYPLDYDKIIDACADNGVHIELNANPQRLDLDYTLIQKAVAKGIKISINPDAHSTGGIRHIQHGINVARKGGLFKQDCLNSYDMETFIKHLR